MASAATQETERFYIGTAEALSAEYGVECDAEWVVASAYNGEIYSVEGFATKDGAKATLADVPAELVEWVA